MSSESLFDRLNKWFIMHHYKSLLKSSYVFISAYNDKRELVKIPVNSGFDGMVPDVYRLGVSKLFLDDHCISLEVNFAKNNADLAKIGLISNKSFSDVANLYISKIDLYLSDGKLLESFSFFKPITISLEHPTNAIMHENTVIRVIHVYYYPFKGYRTDSYDIEKMIKDNTKPNSYFKVGLG